MAKMRWEKVRRLGQVEEKYKPGLVLRNGRKVSDRKVDNLARRAAKAEASWLKRTGYRL